MKFWDLVFVLDFHALVEWKYFCGSYPMFAFSSSSIFGNEVYVLIESILMLIKLESFSCLLGVIGILLPKKKDLVFFSQG